MVLQLCHTCIVVSFNKFVQADIQANFHCHQLLYSLLFQDDYPAKAEFFARFMDAKSVYANLDANIA